MPPLPDIPADEPSERAAVKSRAEASVVFRNVFPTRRERRGNPPTLPTLAEPGRFTAIIRAICRIDSRHRSGTVTPANISSGLRPFVPVLICTAACITALDARGNDSFDILPRSWITGTGGDCPDPSSQEASKEAVAFPSFVKDGIGNPSEGTKKVIGDFLNGKNRIPASTSSYPLPGSPAYHIDVFRADINSTSLTITASAAAVKELRKLSWKQFRVVQREFACWLIRLNQPKYVFDHFNKPIEGFDSRFEEKLRPFWRGVVETSSFGRFVADKRIKNLYFPELPIRRIDSKPAAPGLKMGVVPLRPGMRLAIHWGGTAVYGLGYENITRQTNTGTSVIDLVEQSGVCALATFSDRAAGLLEAVAVGGTPPAEVGGVANAILPFGGGTTATLADKVIPVFNDFDLRNGMLLSARSGETKRGDLLLLIPSEYSKSDRVDPTQTKFWTTDAIGTETGSPGAALVPSVFRRFVLWQSTRTFTQEQCNTFNPVFETGLPDVSPDQNGEKMSHWPGVFGNQTWIDVEVPVSMNGQPPTWAPIKTTVAEFLGRNAARLLDPSPEVDGASPFFSFSRRLAGPPGSSDTFVEFRFWIAPSATLMKETELHPGDNISFRP